ncbi:Flp pilus assembly protein TadD, contains TPR repeats [Epibacterium ulvae]|uniref:Flp pilus assembly protein TadD, contains TPR repeats n=1 Tax=Epibacterium ulvae TaxID=1156985 RepID=A0A1G5R449_9RHOB|nr:tetratricopeptide repeat protein [Epibacterium ulvae]SCZ68628.1 Flp pilus assembly protein TadD, contains TPR repeats [Epibacterium ulvae]
MRQSIFISAGLAAVLALSACAPKSEIDIEEAIKDINVVDETNLNDVFLQASDPNEAVSYFNRSLKSDPDRTDLQRGLATSLIRAKRNTEAVPAWRRVVAQEDATSNDKVQLADALIRTNNWDDAKQVLDSVPPTVETFQRYRLEAIVADSRKDWKRADSFYETAVGLTTTPARVMNNWGYSKLTRGDFSGAEKLFSDAIRQDSTLFTAKNNLVLARGAQRNYTLPPVPVTQRERALLLHTSALSAVKQGDVSTGKGLLREAIATHPQHFEEAARALSTLEGG